MLICIVKKTTLLVHFELMLVRLEFSNDTWVEKLSDGEGVYKEHQFGDSA